jgi:hypothetical protein
METYRRELLVARICSGGVRCKVRDHNGRTIDVVIRKPSRDDIYVSCEVFAEMMEQCHFSLYSEDELIQFMYDRSLWDDARQRQLDGIPKDIDNLKVGLFQNVMKAKDRDTVRKTLTAARKKLGELSKQRHAYDHLSCLGAANIAKSRYLIGKSLYTPSGRPIFSEDDFWEYPSTILDNVMTWYASNRLEDAEIRELARTDPWRSIWLAKKVEASLFGVAAVDHTEEQRALLTWSTIYENAYQHSECPSDAVIEDDDMFDGWMIFQRRKREDETTKGTAEGGLSRKIRDSQEVFLVANDADEAKRIHDLNDEQAKATLRRRFDKLAREGSVREIDMPDTRHRYRMAVAAKMAAELRSRGS